MHVCLLIVRKITEFFRPQADAVDELPVQPLAQDPIVLVTQVKRKNSTKTYNQTAGFRLEVVEYFLNNNKNTEITSKKFNVPSSTLSDWVRKHQIGIVVCFR